MSRVTTADWRSNDFANSRGWSSLNRHGSAQSGFYWQGEFFHPSGIVSIYRQANLTSLRFAYNGRVYSRFWNTYWGDRTINQLARLFVDDIIVGEA